MAAAFNSLPQWQGREGTAHLAPALMTLDTNAVLGRSNDGGGGSGGGEDRLSTTGCALLATILGFPKVGGVAHVWGGVWARSMERRQDWLFGATLTR